MERPTPVDYEAIIEALKTRQQVLEPGNIEKLNIESLIQLIRAVPLGGNYEHAQYFIDHPQDKERNLKKINAKIKEYLEEIPLKEEKK